MYTCHEYQEYGYVPKNCIRTHFKGNYKIWLNEVVCFSYLKTIHVSKNCPTRSPTPSNTSKKGIGKVDVK